jgi:hypothetical protein
VEVNVITHQRHGYSGKWVNVDKIKLLILLLNYEIVR